MTFGGRRGATFGPRSSANGAKTAKQPAATPTTHRNGTRRPRTAARFRHSSAMRADAPGSVLSSTLTAQSSTTSTSDLRYILDPTDVYGPDFPGETFRVLKEQEIARYGEYRTRRLV